MDYRALLKKYIENSTLDHKGADAFTDEETTEILSITEEIDSDEDFQIDHNSTWFWNWLEERMMHTYNPNCPGGCTGLRKTGCTMRED